MLVLTGVTTAAALLRAGPGRRPSYLARGLDGLLSAHPAPRPDGRDGRDGWTCGGWRAAPAVNGDQPRDGQQPAGRSGIVLAGSGDTLDALRALCAVAWSAGAAPAVIPDGAAAEDAMDRLDLGARPVRAARGA